MTVIQVMHLIDTLESGGAERMAVNLVNTLSRERYQAHLCTTRRDGPLANSVDPNVHRLRLERRSRFDIRAIKNLKHYVQKNDIKILHVHSSSLFIANSVAVFRPWPSIVWHVHAGKHASEDSYGLLYRLLAKRAGATITVNQPLSEWVQRRLHVEPDKIWYLPNFVCVEHSSHIEINLPGNSGYRIMCTANLRPEKDHLTLIRAFRIVADHCPQVHLLLAGTPSDPITATHINRELERLQLNKHVSVLGQREDVVNLLHQCDIGVLSSRAEGLPMALLEYGMAGLPVVATDVGQCADVLDHGRAGLLVPPEAPEPLAQALLRLLDAPERRRQLGTALQQRVDALYSPAAVMTQLEQIYATVLDQQ